MIDYKVIVHESILIYALRYALGRRTYAVLDACEAIYSNLRKLSNNAIRTIKRDIEEEPKRGMKLDDDRWMFLLKHLNTEINRRNVPASGPIRDEEAEMKLEGALYYFLTQKELATDVYQKEAIDAAIFAIKWSIDHVADN